MPAHVSGFSDITIPSSVEEAEYFKRFLPEPPDVPMIDGGYLYEATIERSFFDSEEDHARKVETIWYELFKISNDLITRHQASFEGYVWSRMEPLVRTSVIYPGTLNLAVRTTLLFTHSSQPVLVVPQIIYDGNSLLVEWRCGYCGSPQPVSRRECSQCGAQRALLLQEILHER